MNVCKKDKINVFSGFNGMGCVWLALENCGIKVNKRYSSEIDKFANKVNNTNYPDTIQLGDITKWKEWNIDWSKIDLLAFGSPCQGFSFAGKQLAFDDPRSALFFVFVEILKHCQSLNPNVHYLLENVRMKQEHENVISRLLNVKPLIINSALVSAQNRVRLDWSSINQKSFGLFGDKYIDIPQPEDLGILLKDILESEVDEKYYIKSETMLKFVTDEWRLEKKYTQINGEKAITQQARQYQSWCGDFITVASRGRNPENPKSRQPGLETEQMLEPRYDGKTNCLTSVQKDNLVFAFGIKNGELSEGLSRDFSQGARIYETSGKSVTISAAGGGLGGKTGLYSDNYRIRRLTPIECCRLQTVPDSYFFDNGNPIVSETQMYKMLGNGWTVSVVSHIFSFLK